MSNIVGLDQSMAVRPGEELDNDRLAAFLSSQFEKPDQPAQNTNLLVEQFPHGFSNLTYRIKFGQRDMVLRRPPFGANIKGGHDMEREYRVLSALTSIYPKAPRTVVYCDDLAVMGVPFYLMERVEGVILRITDDSDQKLPPAEMEKISKAFIENLATIHGLDYAKTALKELARPGSYVERQVSGWVQRYARAKTDELPALERVGSWLLDNRPADSDACLIHNDYKYDNLVLDPADLSHILAVLDWEMATIGDPLMDLGTSLAYWIEPNDPPELQETRPRVTTWPGNFSRTQLVQQYALSSKRDVENVVFYYVFGLFKVAVIGQQIYARYKNGLTADERFATLLPWIETLGKVGAQVIEKKRIDP